MTRRALLLTLLAVTASGHAMAEVGLVAKYQENVETKVNLLARLDADQPSGGVLMLGDSLTNRFLSAKTLAPVVLNYGIGGQTSAELLRSLPRYGAINRSRVAIVTIGTNDIRLNQVDGIEERMRAIAAALPGPIIWNAVPPTFYGPNRRVNAAARKACASRPDCRFVVTEYTPDDFTDGTHLTDSGYSKWAANLKRALTLLGST